MIGFGQAWTFSSLSFPYNLNDVYFVNDSVGFAVGDNGVILSSNDGGDNWVVVSSGTTNNYVFFHKANLQKIIRKMKRKKSG